MKVRGKTMAKRKKKRKDDSGQLHREDMSARRREKTRDTQDIGELPKCVNPKRRKAALASFAIFAKTYFPEIFFLPWSKGHLKVHAKIEKVVVHHESFALAMPRGSGKTRLCQAAILWGILKGIHKFSMLIGATASDGNDAIGWFKRNLSENDLLYDDFPEVCYPIRLLENEPRRCLGQSYNGEKTCMQWGKGRIVLPTIPGSPASGAIIDATSIMGKIRGANQPMPDGSVARPTLAMVDDPQTPETARSQGPTGQTTHRLQVIKQDVQGLAGPTHQVGILVPCTVIEKSDLADQILDRKKHPKFRGERMKRLYSWPTNKKLWEEYRELREQAMQVDGDLDEATEFYRARMCKTGRRLDEAAGCENCPRAADCMDCGAVVDWVDRLDDPRNLSAVQAAMHAFYEYGPAGFAAEFQNDPVQSESAARLPTAEAICAKANGYARGEVPAKSLYLSAFVDVGDDYLAWLVAAWAGNFTGSVIDYGTFPDQGRTFSKASPSKTLSELYPGTGKDGAILAGLKDLLAQLLGRQFPQEDGPPLQVGLCLVDTGYKPDAVHAAIRFTGRNVNMRPSRGRGITAGRTQFDDYKRDKCREMGFHWWIPKDSPQSVIQIDTNFYKTFAHARLATAEGDPGALTLFGRPADHRLFADHILAEYYTLPSTERGVAVQEWHQHVGRDNEFMDCLVGATVAAAKLGCSLMPAIGRTARPVMSYAQRVAARSA